MDTSFSLDRALDATGALLARRGQQAAIVVVGGTALNLLGVVDRVTRDVDVIATATVRTDGEPARSAHRTHSPSPWPKSLPSWQGISACRPIGSTRPWAVSGLRACRPGSPAGSVGSGTVDSG